MKSRRILSAVMAATLVTAFALPAARAADNSDSMPGRMPDHMPSQMPGDMSDHMRAMPGRVTMPMPGYEQSAKILTPTELCKRYERRFDAAEKTHQQAPFIDEARTLRIEGGKLCNSGDQARGIHKLREALGQLGIDAGLE